MYVLQTSVALWVLAVLVEDSIQLQSVAVRGLPWLHMASCGLLWPPAVSRVLLWSPVVYRGLSWSPVVFSLAVRVVFGFSIISFWLQEFPCGSFVILFLKLILLAPSPSPASVKVPFQGEDIEKTSLYFSDFNEELIIRNCTKMITSCSIRRVFLYIYIYIYIYIKI